ncbi:MAG: AAA family ATPase, partial [Actinomycetota bacterium]|nr:AAA family ATPase [Actinomycetota bacterium]
MTGGAASSARLQVRLLGDFAVLVGRRRVPETAWRQRRAAAIIKLLALAPAHRLHREQITDTLWPALDRDAQANNLRQMLHLARKHLVAAGMPPGAALTREGETVVLAPPAMTWVDAHAFEKAVADAWRAPSRASAQAALSLYGGDLLPTDLYDEWAEQPRIALRASYLALLMRLGQLHAERGAFADAIATFQRLVAAEPTHEAAHAALMRLYAGTSQRHLALGQYDRFAALLVREQDAEPEAQTRALAAAIRDGRHPAIATDLLLQKTQSGDDPPSAAGNLPTPLSTLIGREREIAEIGQLLATSRLVTLTGPGGIGKTRLAIAVARASGDAFPDGIFFVDLTPIRDPALVVPTIARALNVRAVSDEPLIATIVASLREKRLLMVIDNFEHVASAARSVADILERSPSVKAVVTSRRRLRLRGEREHAVPPLSVPDAHGTANAAIVASAAVMLFVARAREARPDFA